MILTAAVIVMLMVSMTYANDILNVKLAQNEFSANKQFMQTTGSQIDDIAWTVGRTQTITYASKFGVLKYQEQALSYTIRVDGVEVATVETGVILYNMPVSAYKLINDYFERVPFASNGSFIQAGASAPVSQVFCQQKVPMSDGSYLRIVLAPTIRLLESTISDGQTSKNYFKFYLPDLQSGISPYRTTSLTLNGEGISKFSKSGVDEVTVTVDFPSASNGFNSAFFNFQSTNLIFNSASTPKLNADSVVEVYVGNVLVNIGKV
jgi:hypothetical protein